MWITCSLELVLNVNMPAARSYEAIMADGDNALSRLMDKWEHVLWKLRKHEKESFFFLKEEFVLGDKSRGFQFPSKGPSMCLLMILRTPLPRGVSEKTSWRVCFTTVPSSNGMNLSSSNQTRFFPLGCSSACWKKSQYCLKHLKSSRRGFLSEWDMVMFKALAGKHFILTGGSR